MTTQQIPEAAVEAKTSALLGKQDARPKRGLWAPGSYLCACRKCGSRFTGDKRAIWCADCAYADQEAAIPHLARPAEDVAGLVGRINKKIRRQVPLSECGEMLKEAGAALIALTAARDDAQQKLEIAEAAREVEVGRVAELQAERDEARRELDELNRGLGRAECIIGRDPLEEIVEVNKLCIAAEAERDALAARLKEAQAALERIERWKLPPTGKTWDDGEPMSYFAVFGWGGERDFIRDIAEKALNQIGRQIATKEASR